MKELIDLPAMDSLGMGFNADLFNALTPADQQLFLAHIEQEQQRLAREAVAIPLPSRPVAPVRSPVDVSNEAILRGYDEAVANFRAYMARELEATRTKLAADMASAAPESSDTRLACVPHDAQPL